MLTGLPGFSASEVIAVAPRHPVQGGQCGFDGEGRLALDVVARRAAPAKAGSVRPASRISASASAMRSVAVRVPRQPKALRRNFDLKPQA